LTEEALLPDGSGVRIADDEQGGLTIAVVAAPSSGDALMDEDGALLFLDGGAAEQLAGRTLDAHFGPDGVTFAVRGDAAAQEAGGRANEGG
jgi:hypothetical protein